MLFEEKSHSKGRFNAKNGVLAYLAICVRSEPLQGPADSYYLFLLELSVSPIPEGRFFRKPKKVYFRAGDGDFLRLKEKFLRNCQNNANTHDYLDNSPVENHLIFDLIDLTDNDFSVLVGHSDG